MKEVRIYLYERSKRKRVVGLSIYGDEGKEELRKVIEVIQNSLARHFPDAQVAPWGKAKALFLGQE